MGRWTENFILTLMPIYGIYVYILVMTFKRRSRANTTIYLSEYDMPANAAMPANTCMPIFLNSCETEMH